MKIPDRWLAYNALGKCIQGTRFICFKVPLKDALCRSLEVHERFTPKMLMEQCPKLGLVIDLTNTQRYYSGETFKSKGIQYKKLQCPGQVIPPGKIVQEFFKTVDAFLDESPEEDKLIGVHCTHGLNRTGYFICRYLSLRMGFTPQDAISAFEDARGYKIERQPFIEDIVAGKEIEIVRDENPEVSSSSQEQIRQNHSQGNYKDHRNNHRYRQNEIEYEYYDNYPPQDLCYQPQDRHYPPPEPEPHYPRSNMEYQSPLAGSSYDDYEPSNRYSRGYGNTRGNRGSYQGYSNHRNHPYGSSSNAQKGPFREQTGRYGNKRWKRSGDSDMGTPRGNRSER